MREGLSSRKRCCVAWGGQRESYYFSFKRCAGVLFRRITFVVGSVTAWRARFCFWPFLLLSLAGRRFTHPFVFPPLFKPLFALACLHQTSPTSAPPQRRTAPPRSPRLPKSSAATRGVKYHKHNQALPTHHLLYPTPAASNTAPPSPPSRSPSPGQPLPDSGISPHSIALFPSSPRTTPRHGNLLLPRLPCLSLPRVAVQRPRASHPPQRDPRPRKFTFPRGATQKLMMP